MKKYILSFALFIAVSATAFSQQKTAEERATKSTEMMEKNLSLSADQKTKIYEASLERIKATDALRAAAGEGNKPDANQMKAINQKFSKVMKETLTEEQQTKMAEMKAANAKPKEGTK